MDEINSTQQGDKNAELLASRLPNEEPLQCYNRSAAYYRAARKVTTSVFEIPDKLDDSHLL